MTERVGRICFLFSFHFHIEGDYGDGYATFFLSAG